VCRFLNRKNRVVRCKTEWVNVIYWRKFLTWWKTEFLQVTLTLFLFAHNLQGVREFWKSERCVKGKVLWSRFYSRKWRWFLSIPSFLLSALCMLLIPVWLPGLARRMDGWIWREFWGLRRKALYLMYMLIFEFRNHSGQSENEMESLPWV
jgi:hypothetical protein